MIINVATDVRRFAATLDELSQRQLPYATALALNQTARAARNEVTRSLPAIFDAKGRRPTPFTMRAVGTSTARKSALRAAVFVKDLQAKYLRIEETGGARIPRPGAPVLTPVDIARNAYGNIPRGMVRRLLSDPRKHFVARIRGVYGLWQRIGPRGPRGGMPRHVKLLVAFRERAIYRPRFGFGDQVRIAVDAHLLPALAAGLAKAIATARRP